MSKRRQDDEPEFEVELEDCEILATTDAALYIEYDDEQHWIPRSQIEGGDDEDIEKGDVRTLVVTKWIADDRGITI